MSEISKNSESTDAPEFHEYYPSPNQTWQKVAMTGAVIGLAAASYAYLEATGKLEEGTLFLPTFQQSEED